MLKAFASKFQQLQIWVVSIVHPQFAIGLDSVASLTNLRSTRS